MTDEERRQRAEETVRRMGEKELIAFGSGSDAHATKAAAKQGLDGMRISEGGGTVFPAPATCASSWSRDLLFDIGRAVGEECLSRKEGLYMGPCVEVHRNPLGGGNAASFSEDPLLSGEMGAAFVQGLQEPGIAACPGPVSPSAGEEKKYGADMRMDERTLREIYLPALEKTVKKAGPRAVSAGFGRLNGTPACENGKLLGDILRKEWGFDGVVLSARGSLLSRKKAYEAGVDLAMPGGSAFGEKEALQALKNGTLSRETVEASAVRLADLVLKEKEAVRARARFTEEEHHALAARAAEESAVLLKNEEEFLPVSDTAQLLLVGSFAEHMPLGAALRPSLLTQVRDCLPECAFVSGCDDAGRVTPESLKEVTAAAARAKRVLVFAGLPEGYVPAGADRKDLSLPLGHLRMIRAAVDANPSTGVVLMGQGPMELPFLSDVKALLYAGLPGQAGGKGIARLITGEAVPGGKLTDTWPFAAYDAPSFDTLRPEGRQICCREGIYTGYRYYGRAGKRVCFPFGFGLSYTSFELSSLRLEREVLSAMVQNVGKRTGSCVVQYYVSAPAPVPGKPGIHRPRRELRGFEKVTLAPGAVERVKFPINSRDFAVWQDGWKVPTGTYRLCLGFSSAEILLETPIEVVEEAVEDPAGLQESWYQAPAGVPDAGDWRKLTGEAAAPENADGRLTMEDSLADAAGKSARAAELLGSGSFAGNESLCAVHQQSGGKVKLSLLEKILEEANR